MAANTKVLAPPLAERARVLRVLREREADLRELGITSLSLFGSIARGDARPDSDVDLLIEVDSEAGFSLFDQIELQDELAAALARPVNFAYGSAMRPWLREWIEDDRIEIF